MERAEFLKQMRSKAEALYDHISPGYGVKFGFYENETQLEFLQKFLGLVEPGVILSAACGAGRYDGYLLDAGHSVVGIDQSAGMLAQAREHFPQARYEKIGLQEIALDPAFQAAFDGAICMDAMEHICPEDWPGILRGFQKALKPGGVLYFTLCTVDTAEPGELEGAYERAKVRGLPVIFGEIADGVDAAYERAAAEGQQVAPEDLETTDTDVYHFYPSVQQVRDWIEQAGLEIEMEGKGSAYRHIIARKKK